MARTGRFSLGGRSGPAEWSFDGSSLVVTPQDGGPISVFVKEVTGVSGDGYTVRLALAGSQGANEAGSGDRGGEGAAGEARRDLELVLSMLGHDGPTLLESLRREWVKARAEVLRLNGSGESWPTSGKVAGLGGQAEAVAAPEPFCALLFEDVLLVARDGRDLDPLFLALLESVAFDEAAYSIWVDEWPGRRVAFSKLAKETDELLRRLRDNRELLAGETAAVLAAATPSLPAGLRAGLAGVWMPGRLLDLSRMDSLCPGFEQAFRKEWLPSLIRHQEGAYLMEWAGSGSVWLGCTREAGEGEAAEGGSGDGAGPAALKPLWMLAGKEDIWFLESLSSEDRATYCFAGGEETPALVSRLLCAPCFSKEALYAPMSELVGDNADLAIPARSLGFLVELRRRFRQRVIHRSLDGWRTDVEKLAEGS